MAACIFYRKVSIAGIKEKPTEKDDKGSSYGHKTLTKQRKELVFNYSNWK